MAQYSISIPSIGCEGCITTLTEVLTAADTTAQVKGDPTTKKLWVKTQLNEVEIAAAVRDAGHEVATITVG